MLTPEQIQQQREAVVAEAMTWLHTPFRDQARVKGRNGGTDCGQFLCCTYEMAGVCEQILPAPYVMQFMLNVPKFLEGKGIKEREMYVAELLRHCEEVKAEETLPADIVLFRSGLVYSHGGILLDPWQGRIIHALNTSEKMGGVQLTDAARSGRIAASLRKYRDSPPRFFQAEGMEI